MSMFVPGASYVIPVEKIVDEMATAESVRIRKRKMRACDSAYGANGSV